MQTSRLRCHNGNIILSQWKYCSNVNIWFLCIWENTSKSRPRFSAFSILSRRKKKDLTQLPFNHWPGFETRLCFPQNGGRWTFGSRSLSAWDHRIRNRKQNLKWVMVQYLRALTKWQLKSGNGYYEVAVDRMMMMIKWWSYYYHMMNDDCMMIIDHIRLDGDRLCHDRGNSSYKWSSLIKSWWWKPTWHPVVRSGKRPSPLERQI